MSLKETQLPKETIEGDNRQPRGESSSSRPFRPTHMSEIEDTPRNAAEQLARGDLSGVFGAGSRSNEIRPDSDSQEASLGVNTQTDDSRDPSHTDTRKRSLKGKLRGLFVESFLRQRESVEDNKKRFIERNIEEINNLRGIRNVSNLRHGIKKILGSLKSHSTHLNAPTDEYTERRTVYQNAINLYYRSNDARLHEAGLTELKDLPSVDQERHQTVLVTASGFLDALNTRLESSRTSETNRSPSPAGWDSRPDTEITPLI